MRLYLKRSLEVYAISCYLASLGARRGGRRRTCMTIKEGIFSHGWILQCFKITRPVRIRPGSGRCVISAALDEKIKKRFCKNT